MHSKLIISILVMSVVGVLLMSCSKDKKHSYIPPEGVIPDQHTAVTIAEAILMPIYGKNTILGERPFIATLRNDVWYIEGSLSQPTNSAVRVGGVAEIEISRKNGTVIRISHGK